MSKKIIYYNLIILSFTIFTLILGWIVLFNPYSVQINGSILILSAVVLLVVVNYLSFKVGL